MVSIKWCLNKKNGLELVQPNPNLCQSYLSMGEESLKVMEKVQESQIWTATTTYYIFYYSLYAVMMHLGVKCEIHSCTIEFAKRFLKEFFSEEELDFTEDSLKARIDSQYYIDRTVPDEQYNKMVKNAPEFLVKCKSILIKLNEKKINEIRKEFQKALTEKR